VAGGYRFELIFAKICQDRLPRVSKGIDGASRSDFSRPGGQAMTLNLPKPIAAYFAADKTDAEAVSQCFTEAAVVTDEGHTHHGRAAIKQWKADAPAKYQYTSEPFACDQQGGTFLATIWLSGSFRGSRLDLRCYFELECGKIASLKITPKG